MRPEPFVSPTTSPKETEGSGDENADGFAREHTWRKCSLVHKIIQHVEYSAPMARVNISAQNATTHLKGGGGEGEGGKLAFANSQG